MSLRRSFTPLIVYRALADEPPNEDQIYAIIYSLHKDKLIDFLNKNVISDLCFIITDTPADPDVELRNKVTRELMKLMGDAFEIGGRFFSFVIRRIQQEDNFKDLYDVIEKKTFMGDTKIIFRPKAQAEEEQKFYKDFYRTKSFTPWGGG